MTDAEDRILAAAEDLFLSHGYNGTSMREIAEAAGYRSVAGLYNHFGDKETLFTALLENRHPYRDILSLVQNTEGTSAEELLPHLFSAVTQRMESDPTFLRLVMIDFIEFNAKHLQNLIIRLQEQIVVATQRFATLPDVRPDAPPMLVVRMMVIQIFGFLMTNLILPEVIRDIMPDEVWKAKIIDVLLHGIITQEEIS